MIDPAKQVLEFINRQPPTVRESLHRNLVASSKGDQILLSAPVEELVLEVLNKGDEITSFWRCIHAIGVIDFIFTRDFKSTEQFQSRIPEEYLAQSPMMRQLVLEAPLRRRYFEQAAAEWRELRASSLSPEVFHQYLSDHMLAPLAQHPRPDRSDSVTWHRRLIERGR